jgi:transposase
METAAQTLPEDVEALKSLVHELYAENARLQEQLNILIAKRFGPSSEKVSPDQLGLFNEAEQAVESADNEQPPETTPVAAHERKRAGRQALPEHLPRVEVLHDLPAEQKQCPCGCGEMRRIGEETAEQLDIVPARIQVIRHIRPKYACPRCEGAGVRVAPLAPQPIPRSIASPGLLAYVACAKYVDGLPLHRTERILQRLAVDIPRATLAGWMIRAGTELLQPLINLMGECQRKGKRMQMDETRVQVLNEPDKPATRESYMWVARGGPPGIVIILFHYADTRAGQVPAALLEGYSGSLQVDAYEGYNGVCARADITRVGCMAHARRKFDEAIKALGKHPKGRTGKAHQGLAFIQKLYRIERDIRDLSETERHQRRQDEARPIVEELRRWLTKSLPQVPPKSATGQALNYLHEQWETLVRYLDDPNLPIDNNATERAIRPFVIGRRGWLFSATVNGAKASANLYSLVETAKANGHEPYQYLRHVFNELPGAETVEDVAALLPYNLDPDDI